MKIRNQIINYFVASPLSGRTPIVFLAPVTMNAQVAKVLLDKQLKKQGQEKYIAKKTLLHVCYDLDSGQLYVPNAQEFTKDSIRPLLQAAQVRITKDFGGYKNTQVIDGSPFSSIRVRSLNSFEHVRATVEKTFKGRVHTDIPVIEANLARMPKTQKTLPSLYHDNKNYVGGYISPSVAPSITFIDEFENDGKKRKNPVNLLTQSTPFILIDISSVVGAKGSEKENAVLNGYRDYLYDTEAVKENESYVPDDLSSSAHLFALKRSLYLGWPFEEVCSLHMESVNNFGQLIMAINRLMEAAYALEDEGYTNPSRVPYYYSFKVDLKTFPIRLNSMMQNESQINPNLQIDNFRIIDYDKTNENILIESPVYINSELCMKVLRAKSRPLIAHFNPAMNTVDIKSQAGTLKEAERGGTQVPKIKALISHDLKILEPTRDKNAPFPNFRTDEKARGVSLSDGETSHLRRISDYYYAYDFIQKMCKERGLKFIDVPVLIGPLDRIFGNGVQGGFMGKKQFIDGKIKIPHEIVKGIFVEPPIIAVNSTTMPSYAEQTETLIHEYSHNLFSITNPEHEHEYNKDPQLKDKDNARYWDLYLSDPDERLAHKEEIKFELRSGKSVDEIIRNKVGGSVDIDNHSRNYPIALKFRELVQEAVRELEMEEGYDEKPTGTN